jgi:hypothetical protein
MESVGFSLAAGAVRNVRIKDSDVRIDSVGNIEAAGRRFSSVHARRGRRESAVLNDTFESVEPGSVTAALYERPEEGAHSLADAQSRIESALA